MSEKIYKPQISDIMEAIFDCGYLLFDLTKCNKNSPTSLGSEMNCGFEHKCS